MRGDHTLKFNVTYGLSENSPKVAVVLKTKGAGEAVKKD